MALPPITSYPLPGPDELPPSRVSWRLDPDRAVLLVHDMQRYFLAPFPPDAAPLPNVLTNIALLRARARTAGVPVVYTAQPGGQAPADRGLQADFWGAGLSGVPGHTDIAADLAPVADDVVFTKWRYSAFQRTNLASWLRRQHRDQLIITGVYAHVGCQATASEAFQRDVQPFLVADGVADFSRAEHDAALRSVAGHCARVLSTDAAAGSLDPIPG